MDNVKIYFSNYFELIVKITSQCKTETPSVSVGHRPFRPKHGSTLSAAI